jgi:DNA-binding transcriptional ArsR family regulator
MTYQNTQEILTALVDPTRRDIFESLGPEARAVSDLAKGRPISRPAVSQHLKVLEDAGLARSERRGTRNLYAMRPEGLAELRTYLDRFWSDVLASYAEEVSKQQGQTHDND